MPRRQPLIAAAAAAALLFFCSYYKANPPSPRSPDLLSSSYLCVYREVPAPLCEGAAPPLHSPCGSTAPEASRQTWLLPSEGRALRPSTPGDFLPDEKVTKESPRGGHPLWVLPLGGIIIPPTASPFPPERAATPGSTQATKQLPRHGLTAEGVTLGIAWGEKKTDLPTNPKWQIGLFLWQKVARVQASAQHQ